MVELVLRSLTVLSDTAVGVMFAGEDGCEVTFRFESQEHGGITMTNGEDTFAQRYRRVSGPAFPLWLARLVARVLAARCEPLPYGTQLEQ